MGGQAGVEARFVLHHDRPALGIQLNLVDDAPHPAALHSHTLACIECRTSLYLIETSAA